MKYYTPSAGDTLVMSNGDMIEVIEQLNGPAYTLLVRGKHAAERNDEYGNEVVISINVSHILYAYQ